MALDEFGNVVPEEGALTPPTDPNTVTAPDAVAVPDLTAGYNQAALDAGNAPSVMDDGYNTPFTQDPNTGALGGLPAATPGEDYYKENPEVTVAGQLRNILAEDSPLKQVTEARSNERAAALGMESSSMKIGAGQKALIEMATPIATKDAEIAASFKQNQQKLENDQVRIETEALVAGELTLQKARIAEKTVTINQEWDATMKGLDTQAGAEFAGFKSSLDKQMETLKGNLNKELYKQQVDAGVQEKFMVQSQDMLNNYQVTVQQLLGSQVFLESMPDKAAMRGLFNEMFATVSSSLTLSAKAAGIYDAPMQDAIADMVEDNQWK